MTGTRFVALLALAAPGWTNPTALSERILEIAPNCGVHTIPGASKTVNEGENYLVSLGPRRVVTVAFIDQPVPLETFADAVIPGETGVEALAAGLSTHRGGVVLGTLRASTDAEAALAAAEALTMVAAALCELLPAVALYWAEADLVTTPEHVRDRARAISDEFYPVDIWTSLRPAPEASPGRPAALVSKGFIPFAGREIEFAPCALAPGEMAQAMWALMLHLIDSGGAPIADGQSFEVAETGIVAVRLAKAGNDGSLPVYRMILEPPPSDALAS